MRLKAPFRVGGEMVDEERVSRKDRMQLAELLWRTVVNLQEQLDNLTGGVATVSIDANLVLWGSTVPAALENAELHRDLTGADLHDPKAHATSHEQGQSDALSVGIPVPAGQARAEGVATNYCRRDHSHSFVEAGAAELTLGNIAVNQVVQRVGALLQGLTLGSGATAGFADNEDVTFVGANANLANTPDPADSLMLFTRAATADSFTSGWTLLVQGAAEQYTLAANVVTLNMGAADPGAEFRAWYRY